MSFIFCSSDFFLAINSKLFSFSGYMKLISKRLFLFSFGFCIIDILIVFSFWIPSLIFLLLLFPLLEGEHDNLLSFFLFKLSKPIFGFLFPLLPSVILLLPVVERFAGCSLSKYLLFSSLCILE